MIALAASRIPVRIEGLVALAGVIHLDLSLLMCGSQGGSAFRDGWTTGKPLSHPPHLSQRSRS